MTSKFSELTSRQYKILIDLYIEFNSDFQLISEETKKNFYDILHWIKDPSDTQKPWNRNFSKSTEKNGE